jgi:hypothetical protein
MHQTQGYPSTLKNKTKQNKNSNVPKNKDRPEHSDNGKSEYPTISNDRSFSQNINKETSELLHTLDQIDMVDIYRIFHTTTRQYEFFSSVHEAFSKIGHILDTKQVLTNSRN